MTKAPLWPGMIWIAEIKTVQEIGTFGVKRTASAGSRRKHKRDRERRRRQRLEKKTRAWTTGLEMRGGSSGLVRAAGVPLLRLLAEESGLRAGLSKALVRPGFAPGHDRGQVLVDVAVGLAMGAGGVAGTMRELGQAAPAIGSVASSVTAWRAFTETGEDALGKLAKARAAHRGRLWALLEQRPEGFPQVEVAGQVWDGWIVVDLDSSLVECHSDKQGAAPTWKKHIFGMHPLLGSIANTGELAVAHLREGNTGANTAADNIEVAGQVVAQIPARRRKKIIFRVDGAGATKELLAWIKETAAKHGYDWRYSVGFDVTEPVREAIAKVPARTWAQAITPDSKIRRGAYVTEITGLLKIAEGWPDGMRVLARTEPLHPRHHKQASDIERKLGKRFQAIATDLPGHHYPRLDCFHRNHAIVEDDVKNAKNLGLAQLPFFAFAANQAWCAAVALAADLLAWLRLFALDHHDQLRKATPARLRQALLNAPARLVRRARRRLIRLADDHPHLGDLLLAWTKIRRLRQALSPP